MSSQSRIYRVLVVEDNRPDALFIDQAFAECGYHCEVQFATSRSQALNLLSTADFDLMFTDHRTDYEDAERFLPAVRAVANRMPIIVFSRVLDPENDLDEVLTPPARLSPLPIELLHTIPVDNIHWREQRQESPATSFAGAGNVD